MMNLAVLSNINLDPLKHLLNKDVSLNLYFGGYNQWQPEMLNPRSELFSFRPDILFLYLDAEEFRSDPQDVFTTLDACASQMPGTRFIISTFSLPPYSVATYADQSQSKVHGLNTALYSYASGHDNVFVFDFNRLIQFFGYTALFDDKFWYLGRMKHSNRGFSVLAAELANVLNCLAGKIKKVLVLDLDNTLWGGVAGEEGWQHIQLAQDGIGRAYLDIQKKIKELKQTGVLLAICSKNNEQDVREVFEKNQSMHLKWEDFVTHEINWNPKTTNIQNIASSLNLGLDSLVMLDDSPVERELIKQTLPEVVVPDFPKDIALLNRWFVTEVVYPYFAKYKLSGEDREKTIQYKRNIDREKIRQTLNFEEFLSQLRIKLTFHGPRPELLFRIAQLTQKTNQFNLTGRRYDETAIRTMSENPGFKIFACEYEDKFGNEGLTGCAIVEFRKRTAVIDTFLLSCRVLGRDVESTFLKYIIDDLRSNKIGKVEASYIETGRNVITRDFYLKNGFDAAGGNLFIMNLEK